MSNTMNEPGKSSRAIRRVEAPRPLKKDMKSSSNSAPLSLLSYSIESADELVILMDMIVEALQNEDSISNVSGDAGSTITSNVVHLCKHLKIFGPQMENKYQGQLDKMCSTFRNTIVRGSLEYEALESMVDVLELRAGSWKSSTKSEKKPENGLSSNVKTYVKIHSVDSEENRKQPKSSKHMKDEIVIRNSDSGKVMGIKGRRVHMIEQLSDTIISFQRVTPTAKERLVQITGATEENVASAARLIRETIRNNASPVRSLQSESDPSVSSVESFPELFGCDRLDSCESELNSVEDQRKSSSVMNNEPYSYKHKVLLSNCQLTITGDDYTYVTVAKAVLDDYFSKLRQSVEMKNGKLDDDDDNALLNNEKSLLPPFRKSTVLEPSNTFETCESLPATSLSDYNFPSKNPPSLLEYSDITDYLDSDVTPSVNNSIDDNTLNSANSPITPSSTEVAITYTKEFMLQCRTSDVSQDKPKDWDVISSRFPAIVKVCMTSDESVDIFEFEKSDE